MITTFPNCIFIPSRKQRVADGTEFDYAIIDGRQRLQTIWSFIDDEFPLAEEFVYLADETVSAVE